MIKNHHIHYHRRHHFGTPISTQATNKSSSGLPVLGQSLKLSRGMVYPLPPGLGDGGFLAVFVSSLPVGSG